MSSAPEEPGQSGARLVLSEEAKRKAAWAAFPGVSNGDANRAGPAAVHAAYPYVREAVIAEVAAWLRNRASQGQRNPVCARIADDLLRELGEG